MVGARITLLTLLLSKLRAILVRLFFTGPQIVRPTVPQSHTPKTFSPAPSQANSASDANPPTPEFSHNHTLITLPIVRTPQTYFPPSQLSLPGFTTPHWLSSRALDSIALLQLSPCASRPKGSACSLQLAYQPPAIFPQYFHMPPQHQHICSF